MDRFKWELVPLRKHESGCIVAFGFPVFGGWIPYIGFTEFYNHEDDEFQSCFLIEWFCQGIAFKKEY